MKRQRGVLSGLSSFDIVETARPSRRLVLAGLGASMFAPAVRAQTALRDLSIPISSNSFATAGLRLAEALGSFKKYGLNVKPLTMDSGNAITTALVSGSAQVILGGPGEQVVARARGQDIVAFGSSYWGLAASMILSKDVVDATKVSPTAPPSERLKPLNNLQIAAPSATSAYTVSFKGAAEAAGSTIRFVYMAQPAMVAALETGAIQGYIAGAPFWGAQVARGKAVLWLSGPKAELPKENMPASITGFQAMRPFAEANPGLVRQILDGYADFSKTLGEKPDEAKAALAKLYPDVDAATIDVLFKAENDAWKLRIPSVDNMKQEIAFVRASGVDIPNADKLDPAAMIYTPPK